MACSLREQQHDDPAAENPFARWLPSTSRPPRWRARSPERPSRIKTAWFDRRRFVRSGISRRPADPAVMAAAHRLPANPRWKAISMGGSYERNHRALPRPHGPGEIPRRTKKLSLDTASGSSSRRATCCGPFKRSTTTSKREAFLKHLGARFPRSGPLDTAKPSSRLPACSNSQDVYQAVAADLPGPVQGGESE